jgi:hypothetical protein
VVVEQVQEGRVLLQGHAKRKNDSINNVLVLFLEDLTRDYTIAIAAASFIFGYPVAL